jgi:hypothetical protein
MTIQQIKEKSGNTILVGLLSTFIVVGISQIVLSVKLQENLRYTQELVEKINDDYTPLFVMRTIVESNNLMTQEIVGIKEADQEKVKEVQRKYAELQKTVINELSSVRSAKVNRK